MDEEAEGIMADTLIAGTTLVEKESRSIGDAPIGSIVAWAKSLSGVPNLAEGWVECDGSVLVDALSPLNGQTIPDLNGDIFLKGQTTSGTTGGATTASHRHDMNSGGGTNLIDNGKYIGYDGASSTNLTVYDTSGGAVSANIIEGRTALKAPSIIPPFYEVVWIMRIR